MKKEIETEKVNGEYAEVVESHFETYGESVKVKNIAFVNIERYNVTIFLKNGHTINVHADIDGKNYILAVRP